MPVMSSNSVMTVLIEYYGDLSLLKTANAFGGT